MFYSKTVSKLYTVVSVQKNNNPKIESISRIYLGNSDMDIESKYVRL